MATRYPLAWAYLKECERRLRGRERSRMDRDGWWGYVYPKNLDQFEQPKIMLPDYHDSPAAALDATGQFYSITAYCVTLKSDAPLSLRAMTTLLNSQLLFWLLSKLGTSLQRCFVRFMPQYLDTLPIIVPSTPELRSLEDLADRASRTGYDAVRRPLNDYIYGLYGLSVEDIAVIEEVGAEGV